VIAALVILLLAQVSPADRGLHIKAAVVEYNAAAAALKAGSISPAIEHFRSAIEIEPTYIEAYEGLVTAFERSHQQAEMAHAITQLLQIEPGAIAYRLKLAAFLTASGDNQRALAQYSLVLRTDPKSADALFGFARAAAKAGMPDRAAEAKNLGHRLYPADPRFQ
jgi:tetratricopeptide (TPR) repeat protein